jgi:cellulase
MYGGATDYKIPGPKVWDGASSGSAPSTPTKPTTPAASSAAPAPSKTAAPAATSAAPQPTTPEPAKPSSGSGNNSGSLPETFTITQFISWLKEQTSSKARRHAREFAL